MRAITFGTVVFAAALLGACGDDDGTGVGGTGDHGGQAESLGELVLLPAACVEDADCCVVYEPCQATAFVVRAEDFAAAQELAANEPQEGCVRCLAPSVEVRCVDGACAGFELPYEDPAYEASRLDHCGPAVAEGARGAAEAEAGAAGDRVLGCGS